MNCQFLQNSTTSNGGAVSASNTNTVFRFINCSFVGNQAGTDGSGEGGVVAAGAGPPSYFIIVLS
ncbi:hypothetical protein GO730_06660 [Spirosoma sp. HMF3257]|uniref:Uncharacterized protein n=1 Tax=Spirosoma telluris TaxID=2183553 RepID=A0A327NNB0_9BACT|nr:hypothetical protein [Spirosoma telluris]RAI74098.1 hypothetical protein HMF3257_06600 [Spirosoma telluris]